MFRNILLSILLFPSLAFSQSSVDSVSPFMETTPLRVEPSNWWVGFQNPTVQILIYGENIAKLAPTIDYTGVDLSRVERTDNENYLFLYLTVHRDAKPGTLQINLHKEIENQSSGMLHSIEFPLLDRERESKEVEGFGPEDVIYLITPDRFVNGNLSNDSIDRYDDKWNRENDYGRHGGDLEGIINNLGYIEEMGFTSIWLNPVIENAQPKDSYHGYAMTDHYKVDPRYGSNELYRRLSEEASQLGIKLIMDMIMNHIGSEHWWMKDLPDPDWVHFPDRYQETNHRRTTLTDPYASDLDKALFTDGWFVPTMPDLNQDHPLLADYLITNTLWWIEYAGLSGIRHDTHPYAGQEFMNTWTCRVMEEYPNFNIVGEEWGVTPLILSKWQKDAPYSKDFDSCLPSLMDFPVQVTLVDALNNDENWNSGWIELYELLSLDYVYGDATNLVIFGDNHDMLRFYQQLNKDVDLYKIGLAFLMTTRGIPQVYYGSEILLESASPHGHGQIRRDFPGGWPMDSVNAFTGEGLTSEQLSMQNFTKKLLNWRKNEPLIHTGKLMHFAPKHDGVYVYFRYDNERSIMVILNKGDKRELELDPFKERLNSYSKAHDILSETEFIIEGSWSLEGRRAYILELE